jgi:2-keto-4-pentenoate hydratase/2-oxohepta-3-ene-1,7-dioic acid hydratase in catechol pathway
MRELLIAGPEVIAEAVAAASRDLAGGRGVPLESVEIGPPVPEPDKIVCLGLNYDSHASEVGRVSPADPTLFAKFRNCLVGPSAPIVLPPISRQVDYEGELAVVIGARCKSVGESDALDYVAGYTVMNDVSARDLQRRTSQWLSGKAIDGFAPMGPGIVLASEISDPQDLAIVTRLNGEVVQQGSTAEMIFSVAQAISFISGVMTLEPGDIIATGTPGGVGSAQTPPRFLAVGDRVEVEIERVGAIANDVVEPPDLAPLAPGEARAGNGRRAGVRHHVAE